MFPSNEGRSQNTAISPMWVYQETSHLPGSSDSVKVSLYFIYWSGHTLQRSLSGSEALRWEAAVVDSI